MSEHGSGEDDGFVPPSTPHDSTSGYGQPFDVTPAADDVIGSNDDRPRNRGKLPVLLAMVAVIALVLAGGAFALVNNSGTKAGSLTKLVPAGAYGYIQVDLKQSSSAGLYEYLSHFPGSPATKPDAHKATFRDTLLSTVFTKTDKIDYSRDIQPWLGDQAGIAVFRGPDGDPAPLVVIAATDATAAKAGLARIHQTDTSFAYTVVDGDVLLAQHQDDLDAAQTQAAAGALPSSGSYAADIATLPSGSLVTMWADLDRITAAAKSAIAKTCASGTSLSGGCGAFQSFSSAGILGGLGGTGALSTGRVVLGVNVADKVATVTVRALGHKSTGGSAVGDEIKTLPGDTTGAIAFGDVSSGIAKDAKSLSSLSSLGSLLFLTGLGTSSTETSSGAVESAQAFPAPSASVMAYSSAVSGGAPAPISAIPPAALASLEKNPAFASAFPSGIPSAGMQSFGSSGISPISTATLDPSKEIAKAFLSATGLKFPDDLGAILGDRSVIAVGDIPLGTSHIADLQVGIRSHPADISKAQSLATTLIDHVSKTGIPFKLGTKVAGGDFVLGSSQAYADSLAATGNLGSNAQFTAAMGDLSTAHFAAYVDLSKFTGLLSATKEKGLSGFKALGIVERTDGGDQVVELKLLAG
jgi:Protein of unknown function (DUF3352)